MDLKKIENLSGIAKNISEATNNFYNVIDHFMQSNTINSAIDNGHIKIINSISDEIIEDIKNGKQIDIDKFLLLCNYKKVIKEYKNCKSIIDIAASKVSDESKPEDVDEDWFSFFFDKVRLISNDKMKYILGEILAGEVNNPGKISRLLIHILSIMDSDMAAFFCNIVRFCLYDYNNFNIMHPFIFISTNIEAYASSKITREKLLSLEQLGLIQCDFNNEFIFLDERELRIGNKKITIIGDPDSNRIKVGNVILTKEGQALCSIIDNEYKQYNTQIIDFILARLKSRNCKIIINDKDIL